MTGKQSALHMCTSAVNDTMQDNGLNLDTVLASAHNQMQQAISDLLTAIEVICIGLGMQIECPGFTTTLHAMPH